MRQDDDLLRRVVRLATDGAGVDLAALAETVGRGLGARRLRLEVWADGRITGADWPAADPRPDRPHRTTVPVRHAGEQVGVLAVDGVSRARLGDLVAVLGPVLHAAGLRDRIAEQARTARRLAGELGAARTASVREQDEARRALERDLHDGAQHHLVTLRVTASLLDHQLGAGDLDGARDRLDRLAELVELTGAGLAATASGVLPPTLVADGLVAALTAELPAAARARVSADAGVSGRRYPFPVEVAAFYACLEAVNNARKHAPGAAVAVRLTHSYRGLSFAVSDDGPGFDPAGLDPDSGLRRLVDRVATAGGELTVDSAPGAGTTVAGFIPV